MGFAAAAERASAADRIVSINPATGVPLGDVPDATREQVVAAVAKARAAQADWAQLSLRDRCRRVRRFSTELMARADQVIDHYVHTAEWEQFEYDRRVTDWELKRGFERY